MSISFQYLRKMNAARLPRFTNKHGAKAHSSPIGADWSPAQWFQAMIGEAGEWANLRKKYERGDLSFEEYREACWRELADIQTYLDILAMRALDRRDGTPDWRGVDLGIATAEKFNEVSARCGIADLAFDINDRVHAYRKRSLHTGTKVWSYDINAADWEDRHPAREWERQMLVPLRNGECVAYLKHHKPVECWRVTIHPFFKPFKLDDDHEYTFLQPGMML